MPKIGVPPLSYYSGKQMTRWQRIVCVGILRGWGTLVALFTSAMPDSTKH